jgi:hypothetical protein
MTTLSDRTDTLPRTAGRRLARIAVDLERFHRAPRPAETTQWADQLELHLLELDEALGAHRAATSVELPHPGYRRRQVTRLASEARTLDRRLQALRRQVARRDGRPGIAWAESVDRDLVSVLDGLACLLDRDVSVTYDQWWTELGGRG